MQTVTDTLAMLIKSHLLSATFVLIASASMASFAQGQKVNSDEVLQAAFEIKQLSKTYDVLDREALRHCNAPEGEVFGSAEFSKLIEDNLLQHKSPLTKFMPALNMWRVSNGAEALKHLVHVDEVSCALLAADNKRARDLALKIGKLFSDLTTAKLSFDTLALRQTMWEEQQVVQVN